MKYLVLDIGRFARKVEVPPRTVKSFIRHYFHRSSQENQVELTADQYRMLRDYFTYDHETVALTFYNPGRDPDRSFKNVIKLARVAPGRYQYEWYRYSLDRGNLNRLKISEMPIRELAESRFWRSPIDRTVVILNEDQQLEAFFRLNSDIPRESSA